jgi:hypothetical protein
MDQGPGRRFYIVDEERLRQLILDFSPDIRRDTERMSDLIRQMVGFEREKAGLDKPGGIIELWPNKKKKHASDPDMIGTGRIAGRSYCAASWLSKTDKLKVSLLPPKRK